MSSDPPPRHRPADAGEAARLLSGADVAPVLTGSLPSDLRDPVRAALIDEGRPVLSAERMADVEEYRPGDLTVVVGAGIRIADLQDRLRDEGQWLPLPASARDRSAGGLVAAAPASPYAPVYGPVRRQVLAVTVVSFDGERLDWGRAVMKDVAGYDLAGLACGSRARLGLITRVAFRLWPLPAEERRFELRRPDDAGDAVTDVTVGVDAARDWRPAAESWTWSAGSQEEPPLAVELSGSGPSVEAREERLRDWARAEDLVVERVPDAGERRGPAGDAALASLRFRGEPRYLAGAAAALRTSGAAERITAHPREGTLLVRARPEASTTALDETAGAFPDPSVAVDRGPAELHARAAGSRDGARAELERRVLDALGGRPRHWTGDYV